MIDLTILDADEEDSNFKESKGLLRRAFSSRKKKKKNKNPNLTVTPPSTNYLTPEPYYYDPPPSSPQSPTSPRSLFVKEPLRAVRSNPCTLMADR